MNAIENNLKEGETLFADGRIDEATKCFKSILQGDPQNVKALNNLGVIYIQKKDYKTGVDAFLKALENNPEDDDVNMNLQSIINNELVQNELKDNLNHILKKKKLKVTERDVALKLAKTAGYSTPYKVAHLCIDITPNNLSKENPVYLQGFSGKPRVADTAITPLFMKMLLIEDRNYNKTLIVSADIFGFNDIIVDKVKEIVQPWGIPPEAVILNASHNHYAPGTLDNLPQSLGPYYEQYAQGIIQNIAQNMDKLYEDLEPCLIYNGKVDGKIGVNRRLKKDGKVDFGVNPEGYYESHTPFLFIQLLNTSRNLLLVNHGCHPTGLSGAAIIFADFPVYLSELLKQEAFISEVMFLQGAAGSTKEAQQTEGTMTFTNTPEQVALNGKILADQILGQLKEELEYVEGTIFAKKIIAYLPYQQIPGNGEIKQLAEDKKTPILIKEWANILLKNNKILNASNLPVTISLVSLSKDLCFIAFNGEPVAELGRTVLKQFSNKDSTFLLGYTNGLKAYLPIREQITEGGYESDQARYVYNLPAPFDESVEERIKDSVKSLIESWQERDKPNGFGRYHTRKGGGKAFFSLSSGRCGTQTLADILNTTSNARVYHHPKPYLVDETLKAYQDDIDKSKTFWRARKGVINDAWKDSLIFGELDHNMTPFAPTICKEIPDSKFIILIRNPWDYVRSGMRRNYYIGHPWDSGRLCPEVHHQDCERWQKMDQFEKVCWLWNETYLRISKYLEQIPSDNYIVVKFEDLIANAEKSREIFKFLNLKKFRKNVIDSILSKKTNEQTNGSFPKPEEWTFQQHQTLIKECGEAIKKYGYESYKEKYVDNKVQTGKTIIKPVNYMTPDNKSIIKTKKYVIQEEGEKSSEWYDASFENADHWKYHYSLSNYYFLWAVISDRIVRAGIDSVLEIGCGPGQLACLIRDKGVKKYHGFDFSPKRIEQANKACPEFTFSQQDAFKTDLFTTCDYRSVICTEFLEHVKGDLEVLKRIRSGTKFYGTVPNFPYTSHVRHFRDGHDVLARYEQCFEELHVDTFLANNRSVIYYLLEGIIIEK